MENQVLGPRRPGGEDSDGRRGVSSRFADRAVQAKRADSVDHVQRLIDAGRTVMRRNGVDRRSRVADIVEEAGLSNEAFYRHFPSKDALIAAILEDGAVRLRTYLAHQMDKDADPVGQVSRWARGVLHQAEDDDAAATTLAVLYNAGASVGQPGPSPASAPLSSLLHEPFAALGCVDPELAATLVGHAVVGRLGDHLWNGTRPDEAEAAQVVAFAVAAAGPRGPGRG